MNAAASLLTLPDEQIAPFFKPDETDVERTRQEIERHLRRLNAATPPRPWPGEGRDL